MKGLLAIASLVSATNYQQTKFFALKNRDKAFLLLIQPIISGMSLIKNPLLLFIFAELMTLPMFEDIKLINFHKLDKWRNILCKTRRVGKATMKVVI